MNENDKGVTGMLFCLNRMPYYY